MPFFRTKLSLLVAVLVLAPSSLSAGAEAPELSAVEGWVQGNVQQVGFRAFIFKQAIQFNLGGVIENQPDGSVHFILQGHPERLDEALKLIRQGPPKAAVDDVKTNACPVREDITEVVVKGWTSVSRNFDRPADLVYSLRSPDGILTATEAQQIFKEIVAGAMSSLPEEPSQG